MDIMTVYSQCYTTQLEGKRKYLFKISKKYADDVWRVQIFDNTMLCLFIYLYIVYNEYLLRFPKTYLLQNFKNKIQ